MNGMGENKPMHNHSAAVSNRERQIPREQVQQRRTAESNVSMRSEVQAVNRSAAQDVQRSMQNRPVSNEQAGRRRIPVSGNVQSARSAYVNSDAAQQRVQGNLGQSVVQNFHREKQRQNPQMSVAGNPPVGQANRVTTSAQNKSAAMQEKRPIRTDKSAAVSKLSSPKERAKMSKTKVTDVSSLTQSGNIGKKNTVTAKGRIKYKSYRSENTVSDGGGSTIVSVIKAVIYMIFVVVISVFLAMAIILVGNDIFAFVKSDVAVNVRIPENATFEDITTILYENEIIAYPKIFKLYGQLKDEEGPYVAGDFIVSPMTNYGDLMDAFKPQPKSGTSRITIPEGYTTDEIIDLMVSYGIGTREGYEDAIQNYDFDYWFLDELEEGQISEDRIYRLDGYLFPDTYDFYNSSSEVTVLNKLLKRFDQLFTDEYKEQCQIMGYTVDEIITLASLIEKEAGSAAEFFNVSSVFHNRLKNSSVYPRLDSDATIVYAVHHETGERPKIVDTSYNTPYNTYLYKGLPPGPIANPSASAILAALSPAQTKYYFFVSDGSITYFSETKAQHDQYIADIVAKNQ